ncbi:MAG TPA: CapA family protein [Spirochaetia bacterium]|nr:CapA family protein [Spirochaetia bacterium]HRZ64695.1 CapA family protein [Spirochaetia bacterium]
MRPRLRRPPAALLLAAAALGASLALPACRADPPKLRLEAEPRLEPRLRAILEAGPLPGRWSLAAPAEKARAVLALVPAEAAGAGGRGAGRLWSAPALELADPRFDLGESEAREFGLRPLESILPPLRAPSVEGRWPGEEGYPFVEELALVLRGEGRLPPPRELAAWAERAAAAAAARDGGPSALRAVGDLQAGPAELSILASGGSRMAELFRGGLLEELRKADLLLGNLEGPISSRGSPNPRKRFLFRMPPGSARAFSSAGFDLLLFANNHAFDFGPEAFDDTLGELAQEALPFVGAGPDAQSALAPRRLELPAGGAILAFGFAAYPRERLGFTTGEAAAGEGRRGINADEEATLASIRAAADQARTRGDEALIVLAHGGHEYVPAPPPELRDRYRRFAEAGAALVIGSHPHVLQGVEAHGHTLIAYSLGNFLFTGLEEPPIARRSAALDFLLYRGIARGIRILPVIVDPRGSSLDPDRRAAERRFAALCAGLERK